MLFYHKSNPISAFLLYLIPKLTFQFTKKPSATLYILPKLHCCMIARNIVTCCSERRRGWIYSLRTMPRFVPWPVACDWSLKHQNQGCTNEGMLSFFHGRPYCAVRSFLFSSANCSPAHRQGNTKKNIIHHLGKGSKFFLKNYGKFHIWSWPPPPPLLWIFFFWN